MSELVSLRSDGHAQFEPGDDTSEAPIVSTPNFEKKKLLINNRDFTQKVYQARVLENFILFGDAKRPDTDFNLPRLGTLNEVYYHRRGRDPDLAEWDCIDKHLAELRSRTSDEFIYQNRARFFINSLTFSRRWAVIFLVASVMSLVLAIGHDFFGVFGNWLLQFLYIMWLISLGGLGSIAYIFVNVLAIHADATFDISSKTLVSLRIALGCLSGLIIGMPFGHTEFADFMKEVASNTVAATGDPTHTSFPHLLLLLLPFVLGFSTSFLMIIFKRVGDGLQVVFGDPLCLSAEGAKAHQSGGGVKRRVPRQRSVSPGSGT